MARDADGVCPLRGESDFWTPMGSIGPQKSGSAARDGAFISPSTDGAG